MTRVDLDDLTTQLRRVQVSSLCGGWREVATV